MVLDCIAPFDRILHHQFNFPVENFLALRHSSPLSPTDARFFRNDYLENWKNARAIGATPTAATGTVALL
jgi:hypothetical protein